MLRFRVWWLYFRKKGLFYQQHAGVRDNRIILSMLSVCMDDCNKLAFISSPRSCWCVAGCVVLVDEYWVGTCFVLVGFVRHVGIGCPYHHIFFWMSLSPYFNVIALCQYVFSMFQLGIWFELLMSCEFCFLLTLVRACLLNVYRSGCNEHNFASRMECFRCNAPRDSGSAAMTYENYL